MANQDLSAQNIEVMPLKVFTEKAYLDYSMYVILDRALPHLGDGLKPVQRRIIYAMSELGLKASAKYKKSARTVGDVLGKFHPHGDSACYEAMVLMAQDFSYRYPFIDGQGNWGSQDDPKSFAAMRYTESRLSAYADLLLRELAQGTVDWQPNFDGTLDEPTLLPARLPNILLNGASGIAVGMATDIPPHNLREVANACMHLLENPDATLDDICRIVVAPDFPTAAEIITSQRDIHELYRTGSGSVRQRATYTQEDGDIVITALPHQVSGAKVLEQIAQQMQAKKLPMIADLRDESDHENPTRLVIVPRSNRVDVIETMSHLFATTDLERSHRVNLNMIGIDGRPRVKNLLTILQEWLSYRTQTVRRRLQFRHDHIVARLHILDGLLIAYLNIDEVIAIIRKSEEPKSELMKRFHLSDVQADAILEMKLRHLAKLEEMKIRGEQNELDAERRSIDRILKSPKELNRLIHKEIAEDAEKYGDERRSPIIAREEAQALREEQMVANEPVTVVLSQMGWVRMAKGHDIDSSTLNYRAGDSFKMQALARSNQQAIFLDSTGRSYSLPIHTLPSARGQGEPLTSRLAPAAGATFEVVISGDGAATYLLASDAGYGFVTTVEELLVKNRSGKAVVKIPENAKLLTPQFIRNYEEQFVACVSNEGRLLIFPAADLPKLPRGKGNKMIGISSAKLAKREEFMSHMMVLNQNQSLKIIAGKRHITLRPNDLAAYHAERGKRGSKLPRGFQAVTGLETLD